MNQWIEDTCPNCGKSNFVNNGDTNDQTVADVIGIRCWSCGNCWSLGEEDEDVDDEDIYYEDGVNLEEVKHKTRRGK